MIDRDRMNMESLKKDIIYRQLRAAILSGNYPPGTKLPCEVDFARELGVGKVTLRSALARLADERLIERRTRFGTTVAGKAFGLRRILVVMQPAATPEVQCQYILPGIEARCREFGMEVEICLTVFLEDARVEKIGDGCDGILLLSNNFQGDEKLLRLVHASGLPAAVVGVQRDHAVTGCAVLAHDHKAAWEAGLRLLARKGHRRVATLWHHTAVPYAGSRTFREAEYSALLMKLGLCADAELVRTVSYPQNSDVAEHVRALLRLSQPPTALMCFSDFIALEVYDALEKLRLRIPEDVMVMGYCGYPGGARLNPPLCTVDLQYERLGRQSVDLLLEVAALPPSAPKPLVTADFVIRENGV